MIATCGVWNPPHSREVIDLIEKSNKSTVHLSFSLVILSERSEREDPLHRTVIPSLRQTSGEVEGSRRSRIYY